MRSKIVRWTVLAVLGALVAVAIAAAAGSRTDTLRRLVTERLADRLDSDIQLRAFSVDLFPAVRVRGEGLEVRQRGRGDVPPLVTIESFEVDGGLLGLARRPRRFRSVTLNGLQISIPPGGLGPDDRDAPERQPEESPFIIDTLRADGAHLRIIPKREGKEPTVFRIHALSMQSLGAVQRMPFKAELTNPVPAGTIHTEGEFGPWQAPEPARTPLQGRYTFSADLSTIDGIGGLLDSTGEFGGELGRIAVRGETRTPDFRVNVSGQPVPLTTRFQAVVDGTDGDTYLNDVYATFLETSLHATGAVAGRRGVKGRTVTLDVTIEQGRIEDLLRLSVKSDTPPMVGDVALKTDFTLPPGRGDVVDRLQLQGRFDLAGRFTSEEVQSKLGGMSARARGEEAKGGENVLSDLGGRFRLRNGVLALQQLSFAIPGATVTLAGTYGLKSEALEFDGTLRMEATVSEAAGGGIKGFLLKAVDPLFRKEGAGAVLPIRVRGTRSDPKFGLDVVKAITPK